MKCPILQNQNDPLLQTLNKPFSNGLYCEIRESPDGFKPFSRLRNTGG